MVCVGLGLRQVHGMRDAAGPGGDLGGAIALAAPGEEFESNRTRRGHGVLELPRSTRT